MMKKQKLCLAIDTASDTTSVALCNEKGIYALAQTQISHGQGEALIGLISDVFNQLKKSPKNLTHIAVTIGPGSFTGVRIGLATARGLGLALNIPVLGVDNFFATAYSLKKAVTIVLDSKRDDYFIQRFDKKANALNKPEIKTVDQLKSSSPFIACGSGANRLAQEINCKVIPPAENIVLSVAKIALQHPEKTTQAHPLYLRDADVTI